MKYVEISADLLKCNVAILNDTTALDDFLQKILKQSGMTIVNEVKHTFKPQGVSLMYVLAESHLLFETWPENEAAVLHVSLCEDKDPSDIVTQIAAHVDCDDIKINEIIHEF